MVKLSALPPVEPESAPRALVSDFRTPAFRRLAEPLSQVLGDKTARALEPLGLRSVDDLMHHLPRRYLQGTETTDLGSVQPGENVAVVAVVQSLNRVGSDPKMRLEAVLTDGLGHLQVTFFGRERLIKYWQGQLSLGTRGIFVGKVGVFRDQLQMTHPDFVMIDADGNIVGRANDSKTAMAHQVTRSGMLGIYPATAKMKTWQIAGCANLVLDMLAGLDDPMPVAVRQQLGLMELLAAFTEIHRPASVADIDQAVARLKFDEALALQVTMAYRRADNAHRRAAALPRVPGGLLDAFDARLPFALTDGQREVCSELFAGLDSEVPMQRLLQGEVGSGKTVVALRIMLAAVDNARQAVLLAPTEVLAAQHAQTIRALLGDLGAGRTLGAPDEATDVVLLTGSLSAGQRRAALLKIASGEAGVIIGTHALLSEGVQFADLGLVVIDEQHRFGVEQRAVLSTKGHRTPHLLVMTATPIPRSIAMTAFGDLEVSTLHQIPAGRQDVQTTVVDVQAHPSWLARAWQRAREEAARGHQTFVVCPRICASDHDVVDGPAAHPSAAVEEVADHLAHGPLAGLRLGVLHGRLASDEKQEVMAAFACGQLDVLVATTVIEVGVDVPNATLMVILDADRFGVSQLHQLRGRIGRGQHPGVCLLTTTAPPDSVAAGRLAAVAATRDGFKLAELDLLQRREGNVLGAQQSGARSTLKLLRVADDAELIARAREVATQLVAGDPQRQSDWLSDLVTQVEQSAADGWLERS